MPIVIASYRQEWEHRCGRSCNCLHASGRSDFEMHVSDTEEEAAKYIAGRINHDRNASYLHYIFDRWEDAVARGRSGNYSPVAGENSIMVSYTDPEDYEGGYAEYEEYEAEQTRKERMCDHITELVRAELGRLDAAVKQKKREEQEHRQAEEDRKRTERERAEYERLKQQFES